MAILDQDFYRQNVLRDSPQHYWRLNEESGSFIFVDEIENRHLTRDESFNPPQFQQDSLISNNNVNKSIITPSFNFLLRATPGVFSTEIEFDYSIEMWIRWPKLTTNPGKLVDNDLLLLQIWPLGGNPTHLIFYSKLSSSTFNSLISTTSFVAGQDYHIVITRSRDITGVETRHMYVNGNLDVSKTINNLYTSSNNEDIFLWSINTHVDELAVYHKVLNSTQVSNHYFAAFQNFIDADILGVGAEYGLSSPGGKWYYSHNTPGTKWFDTVSNVKGWTSDFNMIVNEINDSNWTLDELKPKGIGIYVNDGSRRESINFLTQEINFFYSDKKVTYDTTSETDYRLIGKGDSLKLFAKKTNEEDYSEIANTIFSQNASNEGNGLKPSVFEDVSGVVHAVWYDDGNKIGQIYYSNFINGLWSSPELVVSEKVGSQKPDILVDNDGTIYVIYEAKITEDSAIGLIYKNDIGWSRPYFAGIADGRTKNQKAVFDSEFNVFVVWEGYRFVHPEICINKFSKTLQKFEFKNDERLTTTEFGSFNPSISSYLDDLFITWTQKDPSENTSIKLMKYFALTNTPGTSVSVSPVSELVDYSADFPDVLVNVSGKVVVVWHSRVTGRFEIYLSIFNVGLDVTVGSRVITESRGAAMYPVLSEHQISGDIYIVWQDFKTGSFTEFSPLDLSVSSLEYEDIIVEDEYQAITEGIRSNDSTIYVAVYKSLTGELLSSAGLSGPSGDADVSFSFPFDDRSAFSPAVPPIFAGELPVIYECPFANVSGFVPVENYFTQIRAAFYNLSRENLNYEVANGVSLLANPSADTTDRDFKITGREGTKEIIFGDFSDTLNASLTFKSFKYYTGDAVEPFSVKEINANNFPVAELVSHDVSVNNYGDVWIVGTCGVSYYINSQNRLVLLQESDGSEIKGPIGNVRAIVFDRHNYMYVGNEKGVYVSTEHINGFVQIYAVADVTALSFDKNNNLYVGTGSSETGSVTIFATKDNNANDENNPVILTQLRSSNDNGSSLPTEFITSIQVDDNNVVWLCTYAGLFRLFRDQVFKFGYSTGLPSERINDIAIRNTAIRYVATSNGIAKMIGSSVDDVIRSDGDKVWNSHIKCVMWQDPNILWAGTLSKVNQIVVDDIKRTYTTSIYEPATSGVVAAVNKNDFKTYYIINDDPQQSIESTDIVDVSINGNFIVKDSFDFGFDPQAQQKIIRFKTPLHNDDVVEVIVRKDIVLRSDFKQRPAEKRIAGDRLLRIKDLSVSGDLLYVVTEGSENEVKVNDSNNRLPFDRIHIDTTPPKGEITIEEQIDKSVARVNVDILSEGLGDGQDGSGVDKMVVSNFSNFTTDGETPQKPVLFSSSVIHNFGLSLEDVLTTLEFTSLTGTGTSIEYIPSINQLYAGTSNPAKLLRFNFSSQEWEEIDSYDGDFVDFVTRYNNLLIVSVGHVTEVAKIFVYNINFAGGLFKNIKQRNILSLSESRAFSYQEFNNSLYIATGLGPGDAYGVNSGLDGGKVYVYDGLVIKEVVRGLDENVYGLTHVAGGSNLIATTGPSGFVYEVDVDNQASFILHNDSDAVLSAESITFGGKNLIFVGTADKGTIRRSEEGSSSFDISIKTTPGNINAIKVFNIGNTDVLYAAIGNVLYYLSDSGCWVWRYTHSEEIKDITINITNEDVHIISENVIRRLKSSVAEKCVYLKLIDKAGNSSTVDNTISSDENPFVDCIAIEDLRDFVNENKIFEVNSQGDILFNISGDTPFYSGQKFDEEKGVFVSEVFDSSNDFVKWETISWKATELINTQVLVYVRSSTSKNDILLKDWQGAYTNDKSGGVDISYLSGQFIQFRVDLISNTKDVSPSFHSANIISVTTESVHFFTTNFILPDNITKGILTAQKLLPVSADVIFALNTTNSVDFSDYQIVEENRLFNMNQTGNNLRVGVKFITPVRGEVLPSSFDEYGPYDTELFVNVIEFEVSNNTAVKEDYHFKVSLYEDVNLTEFVFSTFSKDNQDGFSSNGEKMVFTGLSLDPGETATVLLSLPATSNIVCNTFYFVQVEETIDSGDNFDNILSDRSFVAGCTTSFVDIIDFDFINNQSASNDFHFRVRFYSDPERTNLILTEYSGNNREGWFRNDIAFAEIGVFVVENETVNIIFRPDLTKFEANTVLYLTIDSFNGSNFELASNSFTFQARDVQNAIYCGGYSDVPVVKNFALMFELENNELVTLNI